MRPAFLSAALAAAACASTADAAGLIIAGSAKQSRKQLQDVQTRLEDKRREVESQRLEMRRIQTDVSRLAGETAQSGRRIREVQARLRQSESQRDELRSRLGALSLAEDQWESVVSEEAAAYGRRALVDSPLYGRAGVLEGAFRRAAILQKVRYVETLHGVRRRTEAAQAEAERAKARWQERAREASAQHRRRESLYRQTKEAYQETRQKVREAQKAVEELQHTALSLTHLLRALEKKSAYKAAGGLIPPAFPRHSLPWPADGRVATPFGKTLVPELKTWVVHQGIRLATAAEAPVRPVRAGKVIFSGPFRSYGQVLIVDHGEAFYTIYGLLGRTLKAKGDRVSPSEPLATAGAAPEPRGRGEPPAAGTVYFEIRQSGDALNPMDWLEKRD